MTTVSRALAVVALACIGCLLAACTSTPAYQPPGGSWAPQPTVVDGMTTLASIEGEGDAAQVALHTAHGDVTFWSGVNLGSTTPGHSPGELAITAGDYSRWLTQMGQMGVRFLRIYTIHPPEFYQELAAYNEANATAPIYLVQGVYLPDETYTETGNLFDPGPTQAFTDELRDASAAVSGTLVREPTLGRADGTWDTDVTAWLAAWIIGAELDPNAIAASDVANAGAPEFTGTYFASVAPDGVTTPSERWLAERMDELAGFEAQRGVSVPIAFVNWPTTDPLDHPLEPIESEDLVSIDANHVQATAAWPGGTFASYHAYPYYPDFQRYEPASNEVLFDGEPDAYAAYLTRLKDHHAEAGLPTMVTEFGVPSSLGSAHYGPNGRDQGNHTEQAAMAIDATLMRTIKDVGMAGALLFAWTDEWFKFTWNTRPRQSVVDSERRALWHDPLTNEQWFGVLAADPESTDWIPMESAAPDVSSVQYGIDASYLYAQVELAEPPTAPVILGFDIVPGGAALPGTDAGAGGSEPASDVALVVDPVADTATMYIREDIDPILLDGLKPEDVPAAEPPGWRVQRLAANRSYPSVNGAPARPAEFFEVGNLVSGTWDPDDPAYDSLATWALDDRTIDLRIPWSMLAIGDPSSKTAVVPQDGSPVGVPVETIGMVVDTDSGVQTVGDFGWEGWQQAQWSERTKADADAVAQAWKDVSG